MEKKWQVTAIDDGNKIRFERKNEGCFSALEILGLLDLIRDNILQQMKGEKRPEVEHKSKVMLNNTAVENHICRECVYGNFTTNICNAGYTRCDGQNCFDYEKYEEL